uniref:Uncharacterized protein n=1 Tax=Aegilops tauschii subsp. strangulata TaxID=200361 RepID=A0A452XVR6_AEGTS
SQLVVLPWTLLFLPHDLEYEVVVPNGSPWNCATCRPCQSRHASPGGDSTPPPVDSTAKPQVPSLSPPKISNKFRHARLSPHIEKTLFAALQ